MNADLFMAAAGRIVGRETAARYASKFGDLDAAAFTNEILGYEALAFNIYSTGMGWHIEINRQLWSGSPSPEVEQFARVLDGGLRKLPPYAFKEGVVYRGYFARHLAKFCETYPAGAEISFPAFTSAAFREETAFGGNVLFIIRALSARAIWFLSADYLEDEVLFPTGCRFRVNGSEMQGEKAVIGLQEI